MKGLRALHDRGFRRLWLGAIAIVVASQMLSVAVAWQVFVRTGSAFELGLIGLFRGVPLIALPLWGGVVADLFDRRRVILGAQAVLFLVALGLALATATDRFSLPLTYALVALAAAAAAFEGPARAGLIARIVAADDLPSAITLGTLARQTGFIVGPGVAGLLLGAFDPAVAYAVAGALAAAAIAATALVPRASTLGQTAASGAGALLEGLRYVRRDPVILALLLLAVAPNTFGAISALLPIYARDVLGVGPQGLGLLFAASSAGALVGGLALASLVPIRRPGRVIVAATALDGLCLLGFALSSAFALSLAFLFAIGLANVLAEVTRSSIFLARTPDALRGRITSVFQIVFVGGPQFGFFEQGVVSSLAGPIAAALASGVAVLASTAAFAKLPGLRADAIASPRSVTVASRR